MNRDRGQALHGRTWHRLDSFDNVATAEFGADTGSDENMSPDHRAYSSESPLTTLFDSTDHSHDIHWRKRTLRLWKWQKTIVTPNTRVFEDRLLSRVLQRFPFLVETWYWALIYWV